MLRATILSLVFAAGCAMAADSPWLYGIHWYGSTGVTEVEAMTGGKGIWTLEIVIGNDTSQVSAFRTMVSRGHTIICRIQPAWGMNVPRPDELNFYLAQVETVARAYADTVHIWQIGNEPNLYLEYGGQELTAEQYIAMYKPIRQRIKTVTSPLGEQIVLVAAVSPGKVLPNVRHTHGSDYTAGMCQALGPNDTDGFTIHSYGDPEKPAAEALQEFHDSYAELLGVIDANGFAQYPVYMTEWNRRVFPINDANEAQSAQFLSGAFDDLAAWNANPANHPVICACWFVYAPVEQWTTYSIRYLRDVNPRGAANDLYDAFTISCTKDYPAGRDPSPITTPTPTPPPPDPSLFEMK